MPATLGPPPVGTALLCAVCAYEKPWGVFTPQGAAVCIECRDGARDAAYLRGRVSDLESDLESLRPIAERHPVANLKHIGLREIAEAVRQNVAEFYDETAVDEAWLRSVGWREWEEDCPDDEREFDLYLPIADEIGWECRLGWQSNGLYAVRMAEPETYEGMAESVELLGTRNTINPVTRGQLHSLLHALKVTPIVPGT